MLKNMKFRTQLFLGNGIILLLMIVIAGVVYQSINSLLRTSEWVTFTHEILEQGEALQKLLRDMQTGMRGFLITGQEDFLDPYKKGNERFEEIITNTQKTISNTSELAELVELLEKIRQIEIQWHQQVAEVAIAKRRKLVQGAKDADYLEELLSAGAGKNIMDELRTTLNKLRKRLQQVDDKEGEILVVSITKDLVDQETGERGFLVTGREEFLEPFNDGQKNLKKHLAQLEQRLLGSAEGIKLLNKVKMLSKQWLEKAALPEIAVRREMNKNTVSLKDITAFISKGEDKRLIDEAQQLLSQFVAKEKELLEIRKQKANTTAQQAIYVTLFGTLFAVILGILVILLLMRNIMKMVNRVIQSSWAVGTAAEEISQGNVNLSQRTEQQAASLEETAASMEQMTSTVQQNTDNSRRASQLAVSARDQAQEGGNVVNSAVHSMNEINKSSKQVADIIGVIDDIAFQTNLLALNAAVEAARAGEQGRGFTVVATEVRSLAQRSAAAAKEIKMLIQDSVGKTEEGTRLVNQSGKTLQEIVEAIKRVSDIVVEIASASEEQSGGIQQINKAVMQLDEITQQNAALVEQATVASEAMKDQAQNLKEHVEFFNTGKNITLESQTAISHYHQIKKTKKATTSKNTSTSQKGTEPHNKEASGHHEWKDF